jgi:hypothetical protein
MSNLLNLDLLNTNNLNSNVENLIQHNQNITTQPNTTTQTFDILIKSNLFEQLKSTISSNAKNIKSINTRSLSLLKDEILSKEQINDVNLKDIAIQHKNSIIQDTLIRKDSNFLSAHAQCSFSKLCPVKYKFKIEQIPIASQEIIKINVSVTNQHEQHDYETIKTRGKNTRKDIAETIMLKHGGSSQHCHLNMVAATSSQHAPSLETLNKIKNESLNKNKVSNEWYTNLLMVHDTSQASGINFVNSIKIRPQLSFILHIKGTLIKTLTFF